VNEFDSTKLRPKTDPPDRSWLVRVYSGDRRLLCALELSRTWTSLLGCGFGFLLMVGWFNLASYSPSTIYEPATTPSEMWVD